VLRELRRVLKPAGRLVVGEHFVDPDFHVAWTVEGSSARGRLQVRVPDRSDRRVLGSLRRFLTAQGASLCSARASARLSALTARWRYCRILFNGCDPATAPYRPMGSTRTAAPGHDSFSLDSLLGRLTACYAATVAARSLTPAARCRLPGPHPRSTDIDAPTPSRRVGARNPGTTRSS
jgi:hypothetical protein